MKRLDRGYKTVFDLGACLKILAGCLESSLQSNKGLAKQAHLLEVYIYLFWCLGQLDDLDPVSSSFKYWQHDSKANLFADVYLMLCPQGIFLSQFLTLAELFRTLGLWKVCPYLFVLWIKLEECWISICNELVSFWPYIPCLMADVTLKWTQKPDVHHYPLEESLGDTGLQNYWLLLDLVRG